MKFVYLTKLFGDWFVVFYLWHTGRWREHPAFTAYCAFAGWRSLVLLPPFLSGSDLHSPLYWYTRIMECALLLALAGELVGRRPSGIILGAAFAAYQAGLYALPHLGYPAAAASQAFLAADRWFVVPVVAAAFYALGTEKRLLATGFLVAQLPPAFVPQMLAAEDARAFVAPLSRLAAQLIWMGWLFTAGRYQRTAALRRPRVARTRRAGMGCVSAGSLSRSSAR